METILIAGCGDVGSALAVRLCAQGHRVIGVRRNVNALPAGIEGYAADLADASTLDDLDDDISVLYYTAAADGFREDAYRRAYVQGLDNVLHALRSAPLHTAFFVSSTSVYAQDDGSWVDEDSPTEPKAFSGRVLLEAESLIARHPVRSSAVRFGGIYGPGRTRLIERVRSGAPCVEGTLWTNRIHRDDCAAMLHHLLGVPALQDVYVGVDCEPAPQCEVMDWLAARLDVAPPPRAAATERQRGGNKRCSNRRLLDSGYRFIYPSFRDGYSQLLDETTERV